YHGFNHTDSDFLDDLYKTFFQRDSDASGKGYWQGQIDAGLSREAVILGFMFSAEFQSFMDSAIGSYTQRPETALTMDVYRGALSRLPDSDGFNYWRGTIRTGQCNGTSASASSAAVNPFFNLAESGNRNRT